MQPKDFILRTGTLWISLELPIKEVWNQSQETMSTIQIWVAKKCKPYNNSRFYGVSY